MAPLFGGVVNCARARRVARTMTTYAWYGRPVSPPLRRHACRARNTTLPRRNALLDRSYFLVCADDMTLRRYAHVDDVNADRVSEAPRVYKLADVQRIETVRARRESTRDGR